MSTCGKCGAELKESAKYCKSCGKEQGNLSDKKARVMRNEKKWVTPAIVAALVIGVIVGAWMFKSTGPEQMMGGHPMFAPNRDASARSVNATSVSAVNGDVRIPVNTVEDGNAHFFTYASAGRNVIFFLMKAPDGSIRTAFDACVACNHAKLGYRQEGNLVVCNNCGMGFGAGDIGKLTGGCNPIPVERTAEGRMIVLKAKDLDAGVQYF